MHTLNSAKEILLSLPVEVDFAGFRSTTLGLARAGWGLSMRQHNSYYRGGVELQLAMEHDGAGLYALSAPIHIEHRELYGAVGNSQTFVEFLARQVFSIQHVAPGFRFKMMPTLGAGRNFLESWKPIDATPQEREEEIDMKDFKFFKIADPKLKDIIVHPDQVPELLDLIMRAQKPMLDKVRGRERSRENLQAYREGFNSTKPAHCVQAQIITLAS